MEASSIASSLGALFCVTRPIAREHRDPWSSGPEWLSMVSMTLTRQ